MSHYILKVQEFEHINGEYSMPDTIRKQAEATKAAAIASNAAGNGAEPETPKSTTTSTSATPATSAAASPAPLQVENVEKDKEVLIII